MTEIKARLTLTGGSGRPHLGHHYIASLKFPEVLTVTRWRLSWVGPVGLPAWRPLRMTLIDDERNEILPLTQVMACSEQWKTVADLPNHYGWVIENRHAAPRSWLVSHLTQLEPKAVLNTIRSGHLPDGSRFDPRTTALI